MEMANVLPQPNNGGCEVHGDDKQAFSNAVAQHHIASAQRYHQRPASSGLRGDIISNANTCAYTDAHANTIERMVADRNADTPPKQLHNNDD